jgi:hypothetical protein
LLALLALEVELRRKHTAMDMRRTRVMEHTCGGPIVVAVDALGGWRFLGPNPGEWLAHCPRCRRRLTRRTLRAVGGETVRGARES